MKLKYISQKQETADVNTFIFEPEAPVSWQPGQYMHYKLDHPKADDRGAERYFTIASAPFEKHLQITTRFTNDNGSSFKKALLQLESSDEVEADGPRGSFVLQDGDIKHILIAGGIGITPYRSMILQLDHDNQDKQIELLYANRDENLVFGDLFKEVEARRQNFHLHAFTGDKKIEESDLQQYIQQPNTIFYLSGPRGLVESFQHILEAHGLDEQRIKTDYFPGY